MSDAVTSQTLHDGPKNCVMRFTNISDGVGESAVLKVDVSGLSTSRDRTCVGVAIEKIDFMTDGMGVNILWDATADVVAALLPTSEFGCLDFCSMGGLQNNAGAGKTGDVLFTTVGHASGDRYDVTLHMRKLY
jgi:hypothetical protein